MEEKVLIEAKNLKKYFKVGANSQLHAVDGVNFKIKRGTTLGVVGESGCGKSTLGRLLLRLYDVTDGQIIYDGTDITKLNAKELKPIRFEDLGIEPHSVLHRQHQLLPAAAIDRAVVGYTGIFLPVALLRLPHHLFHLTLLLLGSCLFFFLRH